MNSKEALQKLHNLELWNGELECYSDLYTLKPEPFKIIERDLEVLEIFRKYLDNSCGSWYIDITEFDLEPEETNKIKEWLSNDK